MTGEPAVMWGPSIVGFGSYHYRYGGGRTGGINEDEWTPMKLCWKLPDRTTWDCKRRYVWT